jgi:hypothetical protein
MRYGPQGGNVLEVEHGEKYAEVTAAHGGYTGKIAEGMGSLAEVLDIRPGPRLIHSG